MDRTQDPSRHGPGPGPGPGPRIMPSDYKGIEIIQFEFVTRAQLISVLSLLMYIHISELIRREEVWQSSKLLNVIL